MSPENAKVFVVEDDERWQEAITYELQAAGHTVVAKAQTLSEALATIPFLSSFGVQVATLDANLDPYEFRGYDGQRILQAIREQTPDIRTVGMGGLVFSGVDIDVGKQDIDRLGI